MSQARGCLSPLGRELRNHGTIEITLIGIIGVAIHAEVSAPACTARIAKAGTSCLMQASNILRPSKASVV